MVPATPECHMFEKVLRILIKPKIAENSSGYHLSRGLDDNPLTSPEYSDFQRDVQIFGYFPFFKKMSSNKIWFRFRGGSHLIFPMRLSAKAMSNS
jgi:hypothetical protein